MMTPEQIEEIARRKILDYMEDIIIWLALAASDNPEKLLEEIKSEALTKCNYDDPTVDKELYRQLQIAIKRNLDIVLHGLSQKAACKFDCL